MLKNESRTAPAFEQQRVKFRQNVAVGISLYISTWNGTVVPRVSGIAIQIVL